MVDVQKEMENHSGERVLDIDAGIAAVGGSREVFFQILQTFLNEHSGNAEEIAQDLKAGKMAEAAGLVHTLKGVTPVIGAQRLAEITKRFNEVLASSQTDEITPLLEELQDEFPRVLEAISSLLNAESS